jgi:hypothetical protein
MSILKEMKRFEKAIQLNGKLSQYVLSQRRGSPQVSVRHRLAAAFAEAGDPVVVTTEPEAGKRGLELFHVVARLIRWPNVAYPSGIRSRDDVSHTKPHKRKEKDAKTEPRVSQFPFMFHYRVLLSPLPFLDLDFP